MMKSVQPPNDAVRVNSYIKQVFERNAKIAAARRAPQDPLARLISEWFDGLPPVTRHRRYQIAEIADVIQDRTGKRPANKNISAALLTLGFTRGRDWTRAGRDSRYWLPPSSQTKE